MKNLWTVLGQKNRVGMRVASDRKVDPLSVGHFCCPEIASSSHPIFWLFNFHQLEHSLWPDHYKYVLLLSWFYRLRLHRSKHAKCEFKSSFHGQLCRYRNILT